MTGGTAGTPISSSPGASASNASSGLNGSSRRLFTEEFRGIPLFHGDEDVPVRRATFSRGRVADAGRELIGSLGEDLNREGLMRTPERFAKAWEYLSSGYNKTAHDVVGEGIFSAEGQSVVAVRSVEFYSLCEHHMLPFWGEVSVVYLPSDKILGLSKIPRIVDLYARRLQVQERITSQVADALVELINPRAVVVRVKARHLCMMMRGVEIQKSDTVTESVRGIESLNPGEQQRLFAALLG